MAMNADKLIGNLYNWGTRNFSNRFYEYTEREQKLAQSQLRDKIDELGVNLMAPIVADGFDVGRYALRYDAFKSGQKVKNCMKKSKDLEAPKRLGTIYETALEKQQSAKRKRNVTNVPMSKEDIEALGTLHEINGHLKDSSRRNALKDLYNDTVGVATGWLGIGLGDHVVEAALMLESVYGEVNPNVTKYTNWLIKFQNASKYVESAKTFFTFTKNLTSWLGGTRLLGDAKEGSFGYERRKAVGKGLGNFSGYIDEKIRDKIEAVDIQAMMNRNQYKAETR
jgi:hypothetical protein